MSDADHHIVTAGSSLCDHRYFGPHSDVHHKLGLAVFLIVIVQAVLGTAAKLTKVPPFNYVTLQTRRNSLRLFHIAFGMSAAALLYAQVYTGFDEWNETAESMTVVPRGIIIAFWVLLALEAALYVIGWPIMELLGRRQRKSSEAAHSEKEGRTSTSGLLA